MQSAELRHQSKLKLEATGGTKYGSIGIGTSGSVFTHFTLAANKFFSQIFKTVYSQPVFLQVLSTLYKRIVEFTSLKTANWDAQVTHVTPKIQKL